MENQKKNFISIEFQVRIEEEYLTELHGEE
jgi:hypothetical protein